jgi:Sel1 repeat
MAASSLQTRGTQARRQISGSSTRPAAAGWRRTTARRARLYKLSADQGNAGGQNSLGFFYQTGRGGLAKDDREAARLYKLAATRGSAGATSLGFFYETGRGGLAQDDREAARLYKFAADQGNAGAQASLGFGRQFEGAHPFQPHRVKINAGTCFHVEAAKLELMANFDLIGRPIGPIPGRTEYRPQTAQRQ